MKIYRLIVAVTGMLACGIAAFAFAQMMPYTPPSDGTGTTGGAMYPTGGSTGTGTGTGGTTYDPYAGTTGSGTGSTGSGSGTTTGTTTTTPPPSGGTQPPSDPYGGYTPPPTGTTTQQPNPDPVNDDPYFGDWYGYAEDFQSQLDVIAKKPKKPKKAYLGISVFGRSDIQRMPFSGSALGANWRVGGTATDPIAQGTLTGKGSRTGIRVGLYTGSVYAQFDGNKSNWVANYYSESGAQRSELYSGKSGIYQEETSLDADGNARKLGLLLTGKTLFGTYEGGSFFIVDADALPDAAPGAWTGISIPQGSGPLIPTEKIIELLTKAGIAVRDMFVSVAHAAQSLTPAQIFDRLAAYKKVVNNMQGIQQKFAAFDFNDPDLDYDAVQELVDAYDTDQKKLDYLVTQLGRARLFVRGGDWLSTGGNAAYTLMDEGVDMVPAVLVSQVSGPFDFYTVQTVDEKEKLFAGTCTGRNDPTTGEQVACALRKPTAAQSKAVLKANEQYLTLASQAHDALGGIESALFAPAE